MFRTRSKQLRTLSISVLLVIGVVFAIWESFASELISRSNAMDQTSSTSLSAPTDKMEVELITLRASGFEPLEITRPKGPFILLVEDRSGKEHSSFTLQHVKGQQVRDVNTDRMKFEWHDVINVPPGDYLLISANSGSTCHITILP